MKSRIRDRDRVHVERLWLVDDEIQPMELRRHNGFGQSMGSFCKQLVVQHIHVKVLELRRRWFSNRHCWYGYQICWHVSVVKQPVLKFEKWYHHAFLKYFVAGFHELSGHHCNYHHDGVIEEHVRSCIHDWLQRLKNSG